MNHPETPPGSPATRKRRWLKYLIEALLLVLVVVAVRVYQTRGMVEGPAPVFDAVLLDGTPVSLATARDRPLLLHFWATWCPICRVEQDSIQSISADHAVLTVSIDDMTAAELEKWMKAQGVDYPVIADAGARLSRRYGILGVPTSIIIDTDNRIRFVEVGYTTEAGLRLRLWWAGR